MSAAAEAMTAGRRTKASSGWRRCPPDGTNYAYWERPGGWLIETKPRFRPAIPYTLYPSPAAIGCEPWTINFPTLELAKAAANSTREWLCEQMREELWSFLSILTAADKPRIIERLVEMANEEDERRTRQRK